MRPWLQAHLLVALLLLTACATDAGRVVPHSSIQVHLDSGAGTPRILTPPRRAPVEVTQAQFEATLARLVPELELPSPPRQRLALISWSKPGQEDERAAMSRGYHSWCERRGTPGDCLSLLGTGLDLGPEARRTLALTIPLGSVWDGAVGVWAEMVDPVALQSMLMSAMAGYLVMLAFPNPVTQAAAVSFGCLMVAYLGLDTVWSLLEGWRRLEQETQQARTFNEVREAGERFGRVMGAQVGRLLVMLATVAIGSTTHLMLKGPPPGLPGFTQATRTAKTQLGLRLAAVGQVRQVLVGPGSFTLTLAPSALAMASQGSNDEDNTSAPNQTAQTHAPKGYRLQEIESWRKPSFTEDGKLLPYKGTRNPPNPITNLGHNRAGQTVSNGKATVKFDKDGFPEFDTKFETILDDIHIGSKRPELHFKAANKNLYNAIQKDLDLARTLGFAPADIERLLTLRKAPPGYTWHHHQDVGRMQLITAEENRLSLPHTGGMAIWGGGQ
ncbi:HNH endonuclease [Archangium violaceum]|uniref:HNH endonuclease n=1 Tax=Archangium violaceum TaxID=83451 RepID=UPI002B2BB8C3|nr:HNH endonuclease [Archangium violaceum]